MDCAELRIAPPYTASFSLWRARLDSPFACVFPAIAFVRSQAGQLDQFVALERCDFARSARIDHAVLGQLRTRPSLELSMHLFIGTDQGIDLRFDSGQLPLQEAEHLAYRGMDALRTLVQAVFLFGHLLTELCAAIEQRGQLFTLGADRAARWRLLLLGEAQQRTGIRVGFGLIPSLWAKAARAWG